MSLSQDDRSAILDKEVRAYTGKGYQVTVRTATTAQLVKPKRFSFLIALVCLLFFIVPLVFYIFWYIAAKDATVYLDVDQNGKINRR